MRGLDGVVVEGRVVICFVVVARASVDAMAPSAHSFERRLPSSSSAGTNRPMRAALLGT